MSAPRYWCINNIQAGADLWAIGEFQLYDGTTRVDLAATLSSTATPTSGSLSSLYDGLTNSEVTWNYSTYTNSSFALVWDFGVGGQALNSIKIGTGALQSQRTRRFNLSYSDDGITWNDAANASVTWSGAFTLSTLSSESSFGSNTETFNTDPTGKYTTILGGPSIYWDNAAGAIRIDGSIAQHFVRLSNIGKLTANTNSWVEMDVKMVSDQAVRRHAGMYLSTGNGAEGYRIMGIDSKMGAGPWSAGGVESLFYSSNNDAGNSFVVGTTFKMRVERSATGIFKVICDGVLVFTSNVYTEYGDLYPGFFVYGSSILVYEVRCSSTTTLRTLGGTASIFLESFYTKPSPTFVNSIPTSASIVSFSTIPIPVGSIAATNNAPTANILAIEPGTLDSPVHLMSLPSSFPGYSGSSGMVDDTTIAVTRTIPDWAFDSRGYFQNNTVGASLGQLPFTPTVGIPISGKITGRTKVLGVVSGNKKVRLYYRPTGKQISEQYSDPITGLYTFTGLEPGVNLYYIAAFDNDNPNIIECDAMIHDAIKPI